MAELDAWYKVATPRNEVRADAGRNNPPTERSVQQRRDFKVSIHASRQAIITVPYLFQSTRPDELRVVGHNVSIHASRAGGDIARQGSQT